MKPTEQKRKRPTKVCKPDAYPLLPCPEIDEVLKTTLSGLNARDRARVSMVFRVRSIALLQIMQFWMLHYLILLHRGSTLFLGD